ncbi:MAG: DUF4446 family protein [Clostridia bacterium]|nr:DUF4446 family protein [Clostridia bacterium]
MEEFFAKLSEIMSFDLQVYIIMGVFFILLLLCFILLLVVGGKYKKLAARVEELEQNQGRGGEGDAEKGTETQPRYENAFVDLSPAEEPAEEESEQPDADEKTADEEKAEEEAAEAEPARQEEDAAEETEPGEDAEAAEEEEQTAGEAANSAADDEFRQEIRGEISQLREKTEEIERIQRKSFDKIKVVRYSSNLPDGSETIGYSIGITNQEKDGIVLTGTEQADGATALVVKSVKGGVSKVPLTAAEDCAIKRASK